MFESNSKIPKFFICMQLAVAIILLITMFFSVKLVAAVYFIAILISAVFLVLDKRFGSILTNYKLTFLLFDLVNLIAVIAVIYYEYAKHTFVLNMFLVMLVVIECLMMLIDLFLIKNKNLSTNENFVVDSMKLGSMICILTYFFNVSDLYFAVIAFVFELAIFITRLVLNRDTHDLKQKEVVQENAIEKRIHSAGESEGEIE